MLQPKPSPQPSKPLLTIAAATRRLLRQNNSQTTNILMKKAIRISIIASCLGIAFLSLSATNTNAQGVLREILDRMDKYNKSITSLQADVTMVKYDSTLKISETYNGSTSYLPKAKGHDRYARIDWTKPTQESIAVIGEEYELYRPRLNQVIYGKAKDEKGKAGNLLSFMSMSRDELKDKFDVAYIGQEQIQGGTDTWHIELTPKTGQDYKKADLWIDADGSPRQARVLERNSDTTTILISGVKKNPTIKASVFVLNYDKGKVKRIPG